MYLIDLQVSGTIEEQDKQDNAMDKFLATQDEDIDNRSQEEGPLHLGKGHRSLEWGWRIGVECVAVETLWKGRNLAERV